MHQGLSVKEFEDWPPYVDGSLDAGLWCLHAISGRGDSYTLEELAHVCGCSYEWIRKLETQALRRMKLALRHQTGTLNDQELLQLTRDICQSCDANAEDARTFFRTDPDGKTPKR